MILELGVYGALCELSEFEINDIRASYQDFGEKFDENPKKQKSMAAAK